MGCSNCAVDSNGTPRGCGDKGHCSSGSCNKLNTYDWIATKDLYDPSEYNIVEVSFKKGSHKDFFINEPNTHAVTGDMVVVETASGYDIGRISLSGELVRLQMKKKYTAEERIACKVIRKANERDLEKLEEARFLEKETMVRARVIARTMGLDMKVGDVEFQGDKRKATFYYTAEGRIDFRELVKEYAKEFRVKIEMRQIGARQESARIGGIGSCGRELCCSTWLSDFKSVNTAAARYQNIAINQSKLSGQCGRLKCCLNYELDTYMEALDDFPDNADLIKSKSGVAHLLKTDIFKGLLYYSFNNEKQRGTIIALDKNRVKEILNLNKKGIFPDDLSEPIAASDDNGKSVELEYADVTGLIELPPDQRKKKKRNQKNKPRPGNQGGGGPQHNQGGPNRNPSSNENNNPKRNDPSNTGNQSNPQTNKDKSQEGSGSIKNTEENKRSENTGSDNNSGSNTSRNKKRFFNKNKKPRDNNNNPQT